MIEIYQTIHAMIFDADRIPYALAAVLVVMVAGLITGPQFGNANPFFWAVVDKIFGYFGEKLDRLHRSRGDLMFRGFLFTVICLIFCPVIAEFCLKFVLKYEFHGVSEVF